MDDKQQVRVALNESRFRELNERMAIAVEGFVADEHQGIAIICECALTECNDMIDVPLSRYHEARSDGRWFIVRPDHVIAAAERAVQQHDGYWLIEKLDLGGEVAEELAER